MQIVAEPVNADVLAFQVTPSAPDQVRAVGACLPAAADEHFYGLGERFGRLDLRGQRSENWTEDQSEAEGESSYVNVIPLSYNFTQRAGRISGLYSDDPLACARVAPTAKHM